MTKRVILRVMVVSLITALLGGGYAIVLSNGNTAGTQSEAQSGFSH